MRCIVENVDRIVMIQRPTLDTTTTAGKRYARHARRRNTSGPTITSATSSRPMRSATDAATQWAVSAFGITQLLRLEVLDETRGDAEREREPDEHDEQRRLEEVVVDALARPVEQHDAVGLRDCPHDPADDRQRAKKLDRERSPGTPDGRFLGLFPRDAGCVFGAHPYLPCRKSCE